MEPPPPRPPADASSDGAMPPPPPRSPQSPPQSPPPRQPAGLPAPSGPRELLASVTLTALLRTRLRRLGGLAEGGEASEAPGDGDGRGSPSSHARGRGDILVLLAEMPVDEALVALAAKRVLSAPVYGPPTLGKGTSRVAMGFVDVQMILAAFLRHVEATRGDVSTLGLFDRMQVLDSEGRRFGALRLGAIMEGEGLGDVSLYLAEERTTLLDAVEQGMIEFHNHRVAMVSGSTGRIVEIISQSDVVLFLHNYSDCIGPIVEKTVSELGLSSRPVVAVGCTAPCIAAFAEMRMHAVSGLALVGKNGQLVGNLSASDLRRVQPNHFASLGLPCAEFLALLGGTSYTGYASSGEDGGEEAVVGHPPVTVRPEDTLRAVLRVVASARTHRVYVVNEEGKPVSVITLTDLLRVALASP